jgi:hypothetical protein
MNAMFPRKRLIGLICLLLFAQSGLSVTPVEIDANDQDAKFRAVIEAAPELPLKPTELVIKPPKDQYLGMVSWLARDPKTGVTWLIQPGGRLRLSLGTIRCFVAEHTFTRQFSLTFARAASLKLERCLSRRSSCLASAGNGESVRLEVGCGEGKAEESPATAV